MEDKDIEKVNDYYYLGIIFTHSGSFRPAMEALKHKALNAFNKIRNQLSDSPVNINMKLFASLIVPVLTYGSDIWAPYIFQDLNETNLSTVCDKSPTESLHISAVS